MKTNENEIIARCINCRKIIENKEDNYFCARCLKKMELTESEANKKRRLDPICACGKKKETPDTLYCWNCWHKIKEEDITKIK